MGRPLIQRWLVLLPLKMETLDMMQTTTSHDKVEDLSISQHKAVHLFTNPVIPRLPHHHLMPPTLNQRLRTLHHHLHINRSIKLHLFLFLHNTNPITQCKHKCVIQITRHHQRPSKTIPHHLISTQITHSSNHHRHHLTTTTAKPDPPPSTMTPRHHLHLLHSPVRAPTVDPHTRRVEGLRVLTTAAKPLLFRRDNRVARLLLEASLRQETGLLLPTDLLLIRSERLHRLRHKIPFPFQLHFSSSNKGGISLHILLTCTTERTRICKSQNTITSGAIVVHS